ncbi:MAG: T9SS type A sorting domain-containing protein, partial [Candidatus Latescibacteria bacterium]|nr:T9SS type A sorting domain-containing protein [Candidatus Latescibacterota bacterium]
SLQSPEFDNSLPGSWATSVMHGTPGEKNAYIVNVEEADLPTELSLKQNYPNPFNPSTIIEYFLPNDSHVTLTIHNVSGQAVSVLMDKYQQAGKHNITWNAKDKPSGLYFCTLKANGVINTSKMVLVK